MTSARSASVLLLAAAAAWLAARDGASSSAADAGHRAALAAVEADIVDAAAALGRADLPGSVALLDGAIDDLSAVEPSRVTLRRALRRLARRLRGARDAVATAGAAADATPAALAVQRAATAARAAIVRLGRRGAGACVLVEVGGNSASIHGPGYRARYRVLGAARGVAPALSVTNDDPARRALDPVVTALGHGRFHVVWGPDLGAATVTADCGATASLRAFCLGDPGALAAAPPGAPDFGAGTRFARAGSAFGPVTPSLTGDPPFAFDVAPPLPDGLAIDPATGAISGTPATPGPATTHRVTVRNARASSSADVVLDVDPALPDGVESLAGGFRIDAVAEVPAVPVKMAFAADGRVFVSELTTGRIRVIDAGGSLLDQPLAIVPILAGPEQGLLGIAVAPDFAASGHLYVFASSPADGAGPDRNRILRYAVSGGAATGPDVIVDDLPLGAAQNAGHLAFGPDGNLYATTGDTGDAPLAQADGSLAGRVLRIAPDGSVPAGNPVAGSFEWCRGFRNPFGLSFDPATGNCFVSENGPVAHDELDFVQPGKNYEWGAAEGEHFGSETGVRVIDWTPVIVPTGIACHDGRRFGAAYAGNVFVGSYDHAQVRRLVLEGIDLRSESVFVQFSESGIAQRPLDVAAAPDGSLWVSTFETIWRIRRD